VPVVRYGGMWTRACLVVAGLMVTALAGDEGLIDAAMRKMFNDCDIDGSGKLALHEMSKCIANQAPPELRDKIDPAYYFRVYDINKNNFLDFEEFLEAVKPSEDVMYEVVTKDGSKRRMSQKDLTERTLESTKGVRMEGKQLVKDEEGTEKIEELMKTNPAMARVRSIIFKHIA
jgi:Ca2+-binding EF-hand superfamily protein